MAICSTTLCYPNPASPTNGIFVQKRLAEVHRLIPIRVVAPIPICPPIRRRPRIPTADDTLSPPVRWPSMFYIPGILKRLDALFYADTLDAAIDREAQLQACRLIDAHFVWPDGVGAWHVARRRRIPFVCTIRGKLVSQSRNASRRRKIAEMLRDADRLIAVSQSLAELACAVAGRQLDIAVIPNGCDTTVFRRTAPATQTAGPDAAARESLGWPADCPHVVAVGHFQRLKGFHRLIEAWPHVMHRCPHTRLILVGGPANEPAYLRDLHRLAAAVLANARVAEHPPITFAGRQPPETVARMLNAADCFALASESEGWCNAIAEALACGCPVVATDVGGNCEQLGSDSSLGRLVLLGDESALADAICNAITTPFDRAAIARAGGQRSWQQAAAECVDVYQSLLS